MYHGEETASYKALAHIGTPPELVLQFGFVAFRYNFLTGHRSCRLIQLEVKIMHPTAIVITRDTDSCVSQVEIFEAVD